MDSDIKNVRDLFYDGSSNFEKIAKAFTVMDIADPVDEIDGDLTLIEAWDELAFSSANHQYALIKTDEKTFGYVNLRGGEIDLLTQDLTEQYNAYTGEDIDFISDFNERRLKNIKISELAAPLTIDYIVGNTTPILSIFQHFVKKDVAFILTDDEITHAVRFMDFDKAPVKLCLFSLLLELESNMSSLLKRQPNLDQYINMLTANSLKKLNDHAKRHFKYKKEITAIELLRFTNLKEKHDMIREHLTDEDNEDSLLRNFDNHFHDLQRLRNNIAHGESTLSIIKIPETFNKIIKIMMLYMKFINKLKKKTA